MSARADSWVRWSHAVNGWQWAVMTGAEVLAEGAEASEQAARRNAIGALFVARLRAELPPAHFAEMQNLNATADDGVCHSHDYCDPNVTMAEAFAQVVGREIDLQSDDDRALWSSAWRYALTHGLGQDAEVEAAAALAD